MTEQELFNTLTLARLGCFNLIETLQLYKAAGSATAVIDHRNDLRAIVPDLSLSAVNHLKDISKACEAAEKEMAFAEKHNIQILTYGSSAYPRRMEHCPDAPIALFYKGSADLNCRHTVSIVGTRHCSAYGQDMTHRLVEALASASEDILVVSGLAYGVDICAHRKALEQQMSTVAVFAHGLDTVYPAMHRETATRMTTQGGLLTEYFSSTRIDRFNFLQRNRIVAALADAVVVVESAERGGSLSTARLANEYNKEVFAFPGRTTDRLSAGCNMLIRHNKAVALGSPEDLIADMGWQAEAKVRQAKKQGIEKSLIVHLSDDERLIVDALRSDDQHINSLAMITKLPMHRLAALLMQLEMNGVVRNMAGSVYHLLPQPAGTP